MVLDIRPLDFVNDPGFTQLIKTLEQSRMHITLIIVPQLYEETKEKVMEKPIALTTDGWRSHANQSFGTFTAY